MGNSTPSEKCALCGSVLAAFRYRPMPQWNVSGMMCGQCYDKKLTEHYIAQDRRGITKR
ncbi:MAG TPA: hypothetical protein VHK86_06630 [Nitrososphaera sp.]|jgi:hypothetical protein|nr:hypothetical protein [Nitrososphaera sp.]